MRGPSSKEEPDELPESDAGDRSVGSDIFRLPVDDLETEGEGVGVDGEKKEKEVDEEDEKVEELGERDIVKADLVAIILL